MEPLDFVARLRVMAVLGAIFVLIVGIADVFVDTTALTDLMFHSPIYWVAQLVVLWFAAPFVARVGHIDVKRNLRVETLLILLGGLALILLSLAAFRLWA